MHQRTGAVGADDFLDLSTVDGFGLVHQECVDLEHLVDGALFDPFGSAICARFSVSEAASDGGGGALLSACLYFAEVEGVAEAVFEFEDDGIGAGAFNLLADLAGFEDAVEVTCMPVCRGFGFGGAVPHILCVDTSSAPRF